MTLKPDDPGYRFTLIASCVFFMFCSAGMLVSNKLVLRRVGLPITVCTHTRATATHALHTHASISEASQQAATFFLAGALLRARSLLLFLTQAMGSMHARRS